MVWPAGPCVTAGHGEQRSWLAVSLAPGPDPGETRRAVLAPARAAFRVPIRELVPDGPSLLGLSSLGSGPCEVSRLRRGGPAAPPARWGQKGRNMPPHPNH